MNNQKILLVSHQFLPHLSPRTTRWKTLVDKLIEMGNEVTILTGSSPDETVENYNILLTQSEESLYNTNMHIINNYDPNLTNVSKYLGNIFPFNISNEIQQPNHIYIMPAIFKTGNDINKYNYQFICSLYKVSITLILHETTDINKYSKEDLEEMLSLKNIYHI